MEERYFLIPFGPQGSVAPCSGQTARVLVGVVLVDVFFLLTLPFNPSLRPLDGNIARMYLSKSARTAIAEYVFSKF